MESRPFTDKNTKPVYETLLPILDKVAPLYDKFSSVTKKYKHDWKFSTASGWMEKIHDTKKALCFVIPLPNAFIISLTIRESEKEAMIIDPDFEPYYSLIQEAKQYSEGYHLQFQIEDNESYVFSQTFIKRLILLR